MSSNPVPGASLNLQCVPWLRTFILFASILIASAATCFAQHKTPEQPFDQELWGELGPKHSARWSKNFIIYYDRTIVSWEYATNVRDYLEAAWDYYAAQGYIHPEYADKYRISVEIKNILEPPGGTPNPRILGFFVLHPPAPRNPYIEIRNGLPIDVVRATCSHETFHFIQNAYDTDFKAGRWIKEATATWVEDEIPPAPTNQEGYPFYQRSWYNCWNEGLSLTTDLRHHPRWGVMPYGSAAFFKYLTEHHPKGNDLIKKIWENHKALQSNKDLLAAILFEVGGSELFKEYFTRFCAALYVKNSPPYDFKRAAEIREKITTRDLKGRNEWYYYSAPLTGTIKEHTIAELQLPLSAVYYEIKAPRDLTDPSNLYITLSQMQDGSITFAIIKLFSGLNGPRVDVETITAMPKNNLIIKKIPNFASDFDRITKVAVVSCNTSPTIDSTFGIRYAISEPPYLKGVKVYKDGQRNLIYHARWNEAEGKRALEIIKDELSLKEKEDSIRDVNIELEFSEKMKDSPQLKFGDVDVPLNSVDVLKKTWRGKLWSFKMDKKDEIQLEVHAKDLSDTNLDGDPSTIVQFDETNGDRWLKFESGKGGPDIYLGGSDKIHKIKLKKQPPYLERVLFETDRKAFGYYDAQWVEVEGAEERTLKKEEIPVNLDEIEEGEITLIFSKPVEKATLRFGGVTTQLMPDKEKTQFTGTVSFEGASTGEDVKIWVEASDKDGNRIDGNPKTIAKFPNTLYEKKQDAWHQIKVIKKLQEEPQRAKVKRFLVYSVFTRAEAEAILPDLKSFVFYANDKNGNYRRVSITNDKIFDTRELLSVDGYGAGNQVVQFDLWWENDLDQVADVTIRLETNQGMTPAEVKETFLSYVHETPSIKAVSSDPRFDASYITGADRPLPGNVAFRGILGTFELTVYVKTGFQILDHQAETAIDAAQLSQKLIDKLRRNLDHIVFVER